MAGDPSLLEVSTVIAALAKEWIENAPCMHGSRPRLYHFEFCLPLACVACCVAQNYITVQSSNKPCRQEAWGIPHIRDLLLSFRHKGLPTPLSNCVIGCCYVTNQPRVSHRQSLDTRYTALYSMKTGFPSLGVFSMARKSQVTRVIECLESGSLSISGIKAAKRAPIFLLSVLQHSQYFYHHSQHLSHHSQYFSYHSVLYHHH